MIALVTLVLAVVAGVSQGAIVPLGYYPQPYTGASVHYTVHPAINNIAPLRVASTQYVAPLSYAAQPAVTYSAPLPVAYSAPVAPILPAVAPVAELKSQFHSQDEFGGYHFGHSGGPYSRSEQRDHFGNVIGSYNYVDANGEVQTTHYTAGSEGFKVAATNLPVASAEGPVSVQDTPEVAEAKERFRAAFNSAVAQNTPVETPAADVPAADTAAAPAAEPAAAPARKKRSTTPVVAVHATPYSFPVASPNAIVSPYSFFPRGFSYGFSSLAPATYTASHLPLTYAATGVPAATSVLRNAELLRVENNPGYATSYRVL